MWKSEAASIGMDKIQSEQLRRDVAAADTSPHTVIVELDLPHAQVELSSPMDGLGIGRSMLRILPDLEDTKGRDRRVADAREAIVKIIGKAPETYLTTSGTFVVEANGRQLGDIAKLKTVAAIWPNTHRIGAAP